MNITKKLKEEINKRIVDYRESLKAHELHEDKLLKDLKKTQLKQEAVEKLIEKAESELLQLDSYDLWRQSRE